MNCYQKWLEATARNLVDAQDKVETKVIAGDQTNVIELMVANEDLGKVIGKAGKLAQAMRTLMMAMATKNQDRVILEIIDPKKKK